MNQFAVATVILEMYRYVLAGSDVMTSTAY